MSKIVVVGDIGGQIEVFHQVLKRLGVSSDYLLPEGLTVIQVGDIVRMSNAVNLDSIACAQVADKLLRRNNGRWKQLLGNHESPFAGGKYPESWLGVKTYDDFGEIVSSWVDDGLAHMGIGIINSVSQNVITHAGLSRPYMNNVLKTQDPFDAVRILNDHILEDRYADISITGTIQFDTSPNQEADNMWIASAAELYPSWDGHDMGFHQITGHDIPFMSWEDPVFRSSIPESFDMKADIDKRLATLTTPEKWTFRTVDWVLKDYSGHNSSTWGLLELDGAIIL